MTQDIQPIIIIGAGPVGLAAAAHLLQRGETPLVIEAGAEVGANIRQWQHVRMFSPWEFTVDRATVAILESHGWQMPPKEDLPTGRDLIERYLRPFATLPTVRDHILLNTRVIAISKRGLDKMKDADRADVPFVVRVEYGDGTEDTLEARAIIDASGTYHNPNPMGADGLSALGEKANSDHILYGIPHTQGKDASRYAHKRVMVVGGGHSAINALLDLIELKKTYPDTTITWVLRNDNLRRIYGGGVDDALPARGALGTRLQASVDNGLIDIQAPFNIRQLTSTSEGVVVTADTPNGQAHVTVDEIIVATGASPELNMLRELRLALDASLESSAILAPMIDPNIHSCGTVPPHGEAELRHPEANFYIVGMKSYGRAPTFLLATGYEQVRSVVAGLVGDWQGAREVHLNLPETGVCSSDLDDGSGACCAPTRSQTVTSPVIQLISIANIS